MFDSTNINDIPQSAAVVGFYTDGIYATSLVGVRARFPNATLVGISAVGTDSGVVGDIEPGCMSINQGVAWVRMRRAAGVDPTIYCNETNAWGAVRAAFRKAGTPEPHYWCANYDGIAVLRPGQVARQYANPTLTKHHYDLSVVADSWPGVDDGLHGGGAGSLTGGFLMQLTDKEQRDLLNNVQAIHDVLSPVSLQQVLDAVKAIPGGAASFSKLATTAQVAQAVLDLKAVIAAVPAGGGGLSSADSQKLDGIKADVAAIRVRVERDLAG